MQCIITELIAVLDGRAVLDGAPGLYEAYMLASNLSDGIDYVIRPK